MAFDRIPYAQRIPYWGNAAPVLNPNARGVESVEQAYAFFSGLDGLSRDVGRKARLATASGAGWRRNPTAFGMGVKLAGSTGYFAAPGHQLRPWSRECLFVYGATGEQALSGIAHVPGSDTYDRTLYVNSSNLIAAHIYDGVGKFVAGTTALTVGQAYHVLVTCSDSLMSIYLNGVLEGSTAVGNAGFQGYTTPQLVFGYSFGGGGIPAGTTNTLFYHIEYNSVLSAKDVRHRYLNQLEMFQAGQSQIVVRAAAAGGASIVPVLERQYRARRAA